MGTADKLLFLQDTKSAIKDAIVAKGVAVPDGTTFRNYATKISEISGGGEPPLPQADPYVRPTEWLALPDNIDGVQKVSILNAIFDTDSELVAFTCNGNYTVDWGDGIVENFASGIKAEHKYIYGDVDLNSDTISKFGYKQCVITITPQAGQSLTKCLLNQYHTTIGSSSSYNMNSGFLDMNINLPNVTDSSNFGISTLSEIDASSYVNMSSLERVSIGQIGLTSLNSLFYNCYNIQEILFGFDTSVITSWYSTFYNCYSLQKSPAIVFNPNGVSDIGNMYQNCYSLVEVQDCNIVVSGVVIGSMFRNCYSLTRLVLNITSSNNLSFSALLATCYSLHDLTLTYSGTGKVSSLSSTFLNCYSLTEAPMLDTSLCTTFSNTYNGSGIVVAPDYNYLSATTIDSCYSNCKSLVYVPDITVSSSCTGLNGALNGCSALPKAPNITGSTNVTNAANLFSSCSSLVSIPTYSFPAITTGGIGGFVSNCSSLKVLPAITVGTAFTANSSTVLNNYALSRMLMPLMFSFSVANAKMSASALNEMYTALPTVTGQTVTVTGNYGATLTSTVSLTSSTTAGSKVITMINTSGLSVGMFVSGVGLQSSTGNICTITDATNLITANAHSLVNGDLISFTSIVTTTGIAVKQLYYVINATTDTFQIALTPGGTVIDLISNGSGRYISPVFITSIVPNTSINVSLDTIVSNSSISLVFRSNTHKTYLATMKGWTVTG